VTRDVDIRHLRRHATSGARWIAAATVVRVTAQFVQLALLARLLRVEDFGLMAMVNVVLAFSQTFGDAGVSNAIIYYRDARREELSSLYWLNVLSGVAVFGLVYVLAPTIARFYHQPPLTDLLRAAAVIFAIAPLGRQFEVLFERDLRFRRLAMIETCAVLAGAATGIALAATGHGVWSLVWATVLQSAVSALALAFVGWSTWRPMLRFVPRECRRFMHFGLYQMGERTLNLLGQNLDKLVIGALMGPRPLGFYELAYRLVARPYQIINPIFTRVAFPVFSAVQKDRDRLRKGFLELIEVVAAIAMPLYLGMLALADPFIRIQLGPGYEPTIGLLQVLSVFGLISAIGSPMGSLLMGAGRADLGFYLNVVRTTLLLIAIWIGSRWGLTGIAWSIVIVATAIMLPVSLYIRWRLVGMRSGEYLAHLAPYFWCALAAAAVAGGLHRLLAWPNPLVELVALLVVGAMVYLGILLAGQRRRLDRILAMVRS
jgi:O-antigen/teichoic acid export membrane protein